MLGLLPWVVALTCWLVLGVAVYDVLFDCDLVGYFVLVWVLLLVICFAVWVIISLEVCLFGCWFLFWVCVCCIFVFGLSLVDCLCFGLWR